MVNVIGNLSNTGDIEVAASGSGFPPRPQLGPSTLNVSGTLTNQSTGTLNVNVPQGAEYPSPGVLNAQKLVNYGAAAFNAGTASTAQFLENRGTVNIFGDAAGDIGSLTVGTLKPEAGLIEVWNNGGLLVVGSGAVPAAITGYYQLANGVLDAAGGALVVEGPVDLNGTLDVMLGNGYKPIGTVFTVLTGTSFLNAFSGAFSNVEGLVFDDGRERYLLNYDYTGASVTLTVENNATPEPGSMFLVSAGFGGVLAGGARKRFWRRPGASSSHML
ncbi:MAG: hypothetical protein M3Y72_14840 [Acidobacteriota bacterium]|nr:hypothetical protein [Acidobacteriota bacterium]